MKTLIGWSVLAATLTASAFASADQPVTQTSKTTTVESTTGTPSLTATPAPASSSSIVTSQSMTTTTTTVPASTTTVTSADTDTGLPPPASTTPPPRDTEIIYKKSTPNKAFLITGGALFLGSYATTAALAGASDTDRDRHLYIPVVGPWLALDDSDFSTRDTVLIAGSGVAQGAGIALVLASLFVPEKVPAATISAGNTKINFAPASFGLASGGASAVGTF